MKKSFVMAISAVMVLGASAVQADTRVSINVGLGTPGYWGVVPAIAGYTPRVWNVDPVVAVGTALVGAALYLNVPNDHRRHWNQYCSVYGACSKPVHFLQGNWYRQVYVPAYQKRYVKDRPGEWQRPYMHRGEPPIRYRNEKVKAPPKGQGPFGGPAPNFMKPGAAANPGYRPGGPKGPGPGGPKGPGGPR